MFRESITFPCLHTVAIETARVSGRAAVRHSFRETLYFSTTTRELEEKRRRDAKRVTGGGRRRIDDRFEVYDAPDRSAGADRAETGILSCG